MPDTTFSLGFPSFTQSIAVPILFGAIYLAYWQYRTGARRRRLIREHGCLPLKRSPGLNHWSDYIFGWRNFWENLAANKNHELLNLIHRRNQKYGTVYSLKVANMSIVSTTEPEILKTVLATNFKDWNLPDVRKAAFNPLLGKGIFTTDGAEWQHSRDLLRPNFVRNQVADLATFERHIQKLIMAIPRDGSTTDLQELFFRLTIDSATEFLFGESTHSLDPQSSSASAARFAAAYNNSQDAVGEAARLGNWLRWLLEKRGVKDDIKYTHEFVDRYVRLGLEHRRRNEQDIEAKAPEEKGEGRYVFLHELVKAIDDPVRLRSELLNILLAGRDTTASLLSNVFFTLSHRPDIWTKLRAEIAFLGHSPPTYAQLKELKYLRWVLNESLRLYPVVPSNTRQALVDTVLPLGGGPQGTSPLLIPAGTLLSWSVYAMHRRPSLFGPDAETFRPERWDRLKTGWEYLPFNGGPRICIGQQFALTEASYTTVRLLQEFAGIENRSVGKDNKAARGGWEENLTITCVCRETRVALTPARAAGEATV
ncbi:MAG: hypothetical protein LQ351_007104 [Letrouitia transgressa]|nr:MAG: hypothetical protein LQ351_007104 [Letrouitia transgressa]